LDKTKAQILAKFGQPTDQWDGIYAPQIPKYAKLDQVETITYARQFGTASGTLHMLFEKNGNQSDCIMADWLPQGREF
jgi:hypothetical protein